MSNASKKIVSRSDTDTLHWERKAFDAAEVLKLQQRVLRLASNIALLVTLLALFRIRLDETPLPDEVSKRTLLQAIVRCQKVLPLTYIVRLRHPSPARYHAWERSAIPREAPDTVRG